MYYRKYRPQTIAELDNSEIRETLGKALLANKFAHAYLLVGPRGTGKTTMARLIAKVVNCTNRKKGEEPCNKCSSCKAITAGSSLDVIEIDAASNTGVDDIRDLREKVRLAPSGSRYKVYIIDEVHMLSTSAFNALLKTLEEPPAHVIFVLATTDFQKLPETIVSRCLVYDFSKTPREDIVRSLRRVVVGESIKVTDEVLVQIADRAAGSHRDAQKFLEQLVMESANMDLERLDALNTQDLTRKTRNLLKQLEKDDIKGEVSEIENFLRTGRKLRDLLDALLRELRDILLSKSGILDHDFDIKISVEQINWLVQRLSEANVLMRDCPVPQLPLELVLIEFSGKYKNTNDNPAVTKTEVPEELSVTNKASLLLRNKKPAEIKKKRAAAGKIEERWSEVLATLKTSNHSLVALLRASRPVALAHGLLKLEVFYKFHKERLAERKNREILEKVVSDIMGTPIKVEFVLAAKGR